MLACVYLLVLLVIAWGLLRLDKRRVNERMKVF